MLRWGWLSGDDDASNSQTELAGRNTLWDRNQFTRPGGRDESFSNLGGGSIISGNETAARRRGLAGYSLDEMGGNEEDQEAENDVEEEKGGKDGFCAFLFPINLCGWAPGFCLMFIPQNMRSLVDCTHVILLLGSLCGVAMGIGQWYTLSQPNRPCSDNEVCEWEYINLLCIIPATILFCQLLAGYDQDLGTRVQSMAKTRQEVFESYDNIVNEIDDLLGKATQTSATLTEGGFEVKRRDFVHFLGRMDDAGRRVVWQKASTLTDEFRRFVKNWLNTFSECSVDPVSAPHHVATSEELYQHDSISSISAFVRERLMAAEVHFITTQTNEDRMMMQNVQEMREAGGGGGSMVHQESSKELDEADNPCCPCDWCRCGGYGCGCFCCRKGLGETYAWGFPRDTQWCCCVCTMMNRTHIVLLMAFVINAGLTVSLYTAYFFMVDRGTILFYMSVMSLFCLCCLVVLINYESVFTINLLSKEINKLQEESEQLHARREQMTGFWTKVQSLTDCWANRTAPRLDLMKELHIMIEHIKDPDDMIVILRMTNEAIELLESKLPRLELWQDGGCLSSSSKKGFARAVRRIYESAEEGDPQRFDKIHDGLLKLTDEGLRRIIREAEACTLAQTQMLGVVA